MSKKSAIAANPQTPIVDESDLPDTETAIPADAGMPQAPETPYRIYVAYSVGGKLIKDTILNTAFPAIETVDHVMGIKQYLMGQHGGREIAVLRHQELTP